MGIYIAYMARITATIEHIRADLETLLDGPEKTLNRQALSELERMASATTQE